MYRAYLLNICCYYLPDRGYHRDLDFGAFFAKAQEITYIAYFKRAMSEVEAIQEGVNYLETAFMDKYQSANADEPVKNPTKAVAMLRKYFEECPLEEGDMLPFQLADNTMSIEKGLVMELPFKHPETGLKLKLFSKYDLLCFDSMSDKVIIADTKTSGKTVGDTADKIEMTMLKYKTGNQQIQYANVTNANSDLIYGRRVNHAEIRRVQTSIKATGGKSGSIPKKQPYVEKLSFALTDYHQEQWFKSICDVVEDMLERYKKFQETGDATVFRKSFGNCASFDIERFSYGCCEFHMHCTDSSWGNIPSRYGMLQGVFDKEKEVYVPLVDKRKELGLEV
jgi:hypothetical protein